jgi:uncharacterized surface protein with fasciclin (FAS1) repeats
VKLIYKSIFATFMLIVALLCFSGVAIAQDQTEPAGETPTVDLNASTTAEGSILEYLRAQSDPELCATFEIVLEEDDPSNQGDSEASGAFDEASFSCVLAALERTGLDEALSGAGPFILFAPTDEAFVNFTSEQGHITMDALLSDTELMTTVMQYHVLPQGESLSELREAQGTENFINVTTMLGTQLALDFNEAGDGGSTVIVGDFNQPDEQAYVTAPPLELANGYLVPIDDVLVPPSAEDVTE